MEVVVGDYMFEFVKWASISVHKRYTKEQRFLCNIECKRENAVFLAAQTLHRYLPVYFTSTPRARCKSTKIK